MSDPQPARATPRPERAEPLQPDRPGSGQPAGPEPGDARSKSQDKEKEQEDAARKNVSEGYD